MESDGGESRGPRRYGQMEFSPDRALSPLAAPRSTDCGTWAQRGSPLLNRIRQRAALGLRFRQRQPVAGALLARPLDLTDRRAGPGAEVAHLFLLMGHERRAQLRARLRRGR